MWVLLSDQSAPIFSPHFNSFFSSLCLFSTLSSCHFGHSEVFFCVVIFVVMFLFVVAWQCNHNSIWTVYFLFIDDFSSLPIRLKRGICKCMMEPSFFSCWEFLSNELILTLEPFRSPDWKPPVRAIVSNWLRVQCLSIKLVDAGIFPLVSRTRI